MKIDLKKTVLAMGLAALVSVPFIAKADGLNLSININDDNEAHFHFKDHSIKHHPEMAAAAKALVNGKARLWNAKGDFGGHRETAIQDINNALDEIRLADDHAMGR
jgi:hypothetical protein